MRPTPPHPTGADQANPVQSPSIELGLLLPGVWGGGQCLQPPLPPCRAGGSWFCKTSVGFHPLSPYHAAPSAVNHAASPGWGLHSSCPAPGSHPSVLLWAWEMDAVPHPRSGCIWVPGERTLCSVAVWLPCPTPELVTFGYWMSKLCPSWLCGCCPAAMFHTRGGCMSMLG